MNSSITKVVDEMINEVRACSWAKVDRLQKVLEQLVKVEIATIEAGILTPEEPQHEA